MQQQSPTSKLTATKEDVVLLNELKVDLEAFNKLDGAVRLYEKDAAQRLVALQQVIDALKFYMGPSENAFRSALKAYAAEVTPHATALFAAFDAYRVHSTVSPESLQNVDLALSNLEIHSRNLATLYRSIAEMSVMQRRAATGVPGSRTALTQEQLEAAFNNNLRKYSETLENIRAVLSDLEPVLPQTSSSMTALRKLIDSTERSLDENYTSEIIRAIKKLSIEVRQKKVEKIDPKRAVGFTEFLTLARSSASAAAPAMAGIKLDPATLAGIDKVSLGGLYGTMGKLLLDEIGKGVEVMKRVAKVPVPGMYSETIKTITMQMIELSDTHSSSGLMYGINGPVKALPALISSLGGLLVQLPKDPSSSGFGAESKKTASANAPPPFAGTLLYRTLDPERAIKYAAQIEHFKDTYEKDTLATSVITQAARLKNIRKELVKRATDLKARQGAAADNADVSFAVLSGQLRQIRQQHFEACKSFVRAVRNFVSIFVTKILNFVRYQHGDAIAYMNYWTNATDLPTEYLEKIKEHNKTCRQISEDVQSAITKDVITKTQAELYAPDVDGVLMLDPDDQYVIYELNSRFADWAQEQSARVQDAFLTGPPSTIEEFMEPHQIILYSLKLVRVGVAAIAIAAAEKLFQSVYRKRVYVYDEDPPNLAWFLGAILLIDLAIHVLVAIVLAVVMSIFARADNTFPINRNLMTMWAFDYFASTVPIALVLLSTGAVLRFKKYFRYKYEGQRAIRAMAKIAFYTYAVFLPIPFYRMTYG